MMNRAPFVALLIAPVYSLSARADVVIYGGPTYDDTAGTGYVLENAVEPQAIPGNGFGVCTAQRYIGGTSVGERVLRWDTTGAPAIELGALGAASQAWAANATGTVVGCAEKPVENKSLFDYYAVRWEAGSTTATELGNLGTPPVSGEMVSLARAVNASGAAVGYAVKYVGDERWGGRAVRWDAGSTVATELGNLGTSGNSTQGSAAAINASGTTVGFMRKWANGLDQGMRAVRWDAGDTTATELDYIGTDANGRSRCFALAISDAGTAVGTEDTLYANGNYIGSRAVRWDAGGTAATRLGDLGVGGVHGYTICDAVAINAGGSAVGFAQKYAGYWYRGYRAVRWDVGGTAATELGVLGTDSDGMSFALASDINSAGVAVGWASSYIGQIPAGMSAVAWGPDGAAIDLNTLLSASQAEQWTLMVAYRITDTNWVSGVGQFDPDGDGPEPEYRRAFLLRLPVCAADFNGDGFLTGVDFGMFVLAFEIGDTTADFDADGFITGLDFDLYVAAFEAGC